MMGLRRLAKNGFAESWAKESLIQLQGKIVDPRYAAQDWRDFQNFVGETVGGYREEVHFICPRPQDVPNLLKSLIGPSLLYARLSTCQIGAPHSSCGCVCKTVGAFQLPNDRIFQN